MRPQPVARFHRRSARSWQVVAFPKRSGPESAYNLAGADVAVPLATAPDDPRP
jgi:hypothetical protein